MTKDYEKMYTSILKNPEGKTDIVISGYYGHNNSGDDALLSAIVNDIKKLDDSIRITVLSKNPKETKEIYGVDAVYRFNIFKINKTIKNAKLLISGGGSLIQDTTSSRSLIYYLNVIKTALKHGVKTYVYANGVGPINKERNKKLTADILNNVNIITLREEDSRDVLTGIGIKNPPMYVTSDPAVSINPGSEEELNRILDKEEIPEGDYAVISVRNWKSNAFKSGIINLSNYLKEHYSLNCIFVPMQYKKDLKICSECAKYGYVLKQPHNFNELMTIAAHSKLVIGMRLHMLMYGANAGVPVIGLSYDPKISSYLSYLNQLNVVDSEKSDYDKLKSLVDGIMTNYDVITADLQDKIAELKELQKKNAEFAINLLKENNK